MVQYNLFFAGPLVYSLGPAKKNTVMFLFLTLCDRRSASYHKMKVQLLTVKSRLHRMAIYFIFLQEQHESTKYRGNDPTIILSEF